MRPEDAGLTGAAPAPALIVPPVAGYGYLARPSDAAAAGVVRYLVAGGRARVLSRAATVGGREWPAGSRFLPGAGDSARARVGRAGLGELVTPIASGLATKGPDLGGASVRTVSLPRVAVVTGVGVNPTSYGAHWYFLERELGLPFDALLADDLDRVELARYDVVVLPDAEEDALGEAERAALRGWVEGGGRLVAVAGGARTAAGLFDISIREPVRPDSTRPETYLATRSEREKQDWLDQVPGVILPTRIDTSHPLAWGSAATEHEGALHVLHRGDLAFEPGAGQQVVGYFPAGMRATSGVIADDELRRLSKAAWLSTKRVGKGTAVLFADDPLFRLFWRATQPLYVAALLLPLGD
jgi:hypothetical protein